MTALTETQLQAVITYRAASAESVVAMAQELLDLRDVLRVERLGESMARRPAASRRGRGGFKGHHR